MRKLVPAIAALVYLLPATVLAAPLTNITVTELPDYVIVGMAAGSFGTTVNINNFELGQITGPLPGSAPAIPANAQGVSMGNFGGGNVAILNNTGTFNLQDVQVSAQPGIGIRCASGSCDNGSSNSEITFDFGANYTPIPATGVKQNEDMSGLAGEIAAIRSDIAALTPGDYTSAVDLSTNGKISGDRTDIFGSGLHVVHIDTGGADFLLENGSWVIDGAADAFVVFVFDEAGKNFNVSNGNILAGTGGIGLNNIAFVAYDDSGNSGTKFDFSNSILNGVSFWDLSDQNNIIGLNNVAGCTQFVGDRVENINDVRLTSCGFAQTMLVPEPTTLLLFGAGLLALCIRPRKT